MKNLLIAVVLLVGLAGCAVVPVGTTTHRTTTTTQTVDGQTVTTTEEFDYIGETTPIEVAAYPGVAFYPRYVPACLCIWPVAFYNGVWINYAGVTIVYPGYWSRPPVHVHNVYVREFRGHVHPRGFRRVPRDHFHGRHGGPAVRPQHAPQQHRAIPPRQHREQLPYVRPLPKPPSQPQVRQPQPHVKPHAQQREPQAKPRQQQRMPAKKPDHQQK